MDKNSAIQLIEDTFNAKFDEDQFEKFIKNFLNDLEQGDKVRSYSGNYIWDDHKDHINTYKRIGKYIDPEGDALDVLIVEVKSVVKLERARTALRNFVIKHLSKFDKDYALVAFYSKEDEGIDWRFSFIKLEHQAYLDEENQKVKTRKEFTPAKRYSFLVGKYEKAHTAKTQILPLLQNIANNPTIEQIESAFSIEKVTDEFFGQYKDLYVKLYEHFENDTHIQTELEKANIDNTRFTKKLLGQIVFLYFLQKKGWLGVPKNEHWGKGKKRFIQDLFEKAQSKNQNYFKDYLQPLFYEALAKERNNENSYYKRFDCRIPFLNGGLFEAEYDWESANITIPESLFRNEEKNKAGDKGTGVLDVFDRYNFTIKEDEPLDKEVAVDPEMLGKVFENLLDENIRKGFGAFYTPREIVHYMCQESLIHYLGNALEGKVKTADIEVYIREGNFALENDQRVANKGTETKDYNYQIPESIRNNAELIDKKLMEIRICDPAIGSGAFPVGLLHELVNAQLVLMPHLSNSYLNKKLDGFGFQFHESINESRYVYRLKRHIIQESIYGVDIDASAIDIARLRLWLSLVVDEDDLDPIETLPNLDYKIVCGNSIIGKPADVFPNDELLKEIERLKPRFYNETNEAKRKELRLQINKKIRQLLDEIEEFAGYKIDFDFKLYFSEVWHEKGGFDVVIGNPPYGAKFTNDEKKLLQTIFPLIKGQPESYEYFMYYGINDLLNPKACLNFINPTNFIESKRAEHLRKFLLNNGHISIISNFRYNVWKNNASEVLIFLYSKNKEGETKIIHPKSEDEFINRIGFQLMQQDSWRKTPGSRFIIRGDNKIMQKIQTNTIPLDKACEVSQGIIVYKTREESAINLHISDKKQDGWVKLLDTKSNIKKYKINWGKRYLNYGDWLWCQRDSKYFTQEKIVFIRLRNKSLSRKLIGAFDDSQYYNRDNFNNIISKNNKFPVKYVLALFNSDVLNYWYKSIFDNVNINPEQVRMLPLKDTIPINKSILVLLVEYVTFISSIENNPLFNFFDTLIESIVYELYFPEELKSANKEILKYLGDIKPIKNIMSREEKLAVIQSEFQRLYDDNHPVKYAIETLDSIEEVRIIKEALK